MSLSLVCFGTDWVTYARERAGNLPDRSFVLAVVLRTPLILHLKVASAGDVENAVRRFSGYPARVHGYS